MSHIKIYILYSIKKRRLISIFYSYLWHYFFYSLMKAYDLQKLKRDTKFTTCTFLGSFTFIVFIAFFKFQTIHALRR